MRDWLAYLKVGAANAAEQQLAAAEIKRLRLKGRINRLPFCPDHRDKVAGKPCRECEIERLQAIANDCLSRLQESEEVDKRDDGTWYWCACGETVGEAADAKEPDDAATS